MTTNAKGPPQKKNLRKSTQFTSGRALFTYSFFFLVWRSRVAPQQAPTIPSIAGSVCTAATVSQTRQALVLKEVQLVMGAQPGAAGCRAGCRNPRSDMW